MEELFSFFVFFLIMAFIIFRQWLIDRQNRKKREQARQKPPIHQPPKSEPVETTAFYESHRIEPIPPTPQPPQKEEAPAEARPRYGFENNIDGRELETLLQDRHLTPDLASLETSELVSTRFAGEYKELASPLGQMPASRIGALLQSQKSFKDVILLSEILKNPYL